MIEGVGLEKSQLLKINLKISEEILVLAHFLKMSNLVKFLIENVIVPQLNRENAINFGCYALLFLMMPTKG
jgi:hypothetical protein